MLRADRDASTPALLSLMTSASSNSKAVGIVAALEREIKPALKHWHVSHREHGGRRFKFFENDRAALVCSGIGEQAGRRAAEALIALYTPAMMASVGFAGALEPGFKVGDLFVPRWVIDAGDSSRAETKTGKGTLVSSPVIADEDQKRRLAKAYGAQAVDMEGAAVARTAGIHGIDFLAVKAISDELGFPMPPMTGFITADGLFQEWKFGLFCAVRPWLWPSVLRLARNTARAAESLCRWLNQYNEPEFLKNKPADLHPMTKAPS